LTTASKIKQNYTMPPLLRKEEREVCSRQLAGAVGSSYC
jgi:hypothetical protein